MKIKNSVVIDLEEVENTCFVAIPFEPLFQIQYERVIRPVIEQIGLKCIKGDEIYTKSNIMADVWRAIRRCRLMIAELTSRNPNVLYEVGLAHAIGKPIILLTRNESDVPFDLKSLRYRFYDVNDPFWGPNLQTSIQSMVQSILEQAEVSTYLEGIIARLEIPEYPQKPDVMSLNVNKPINISGDWKVSWNPIFDEPKMGGYTPSQQIGVIHISQHGEDLSATMTITTEISNSVMVVQEILTGKIQDRKVTLISVSYTFIHQGIAGEHLLDNFNLQLSSDGNVMSGEQYDAISRAEAIFTRQQTQSTNPCV